MSYIEVFEVDYIIDFRNLSKNFYMQIKSIYDKKYSFLFCYLNFLKNF